MTSVATKDASASVVTVACKLPNGLHLVLRDKDGEVKWQHVLRGTAILRDQETKMPINPALILNGFALTPGVDAAAFETWVHEHRTMDVIKKNMIFAHAALEDVTAEAELSKDIATGFEPVDRDKTDKITLEGQTAVLETMPKT